MTSPQELLEMAKERPQILIGVGVALLGIILLVIFINPFKGSGGGEGEACSVKLDAGQLPLATINSPGQAIEIQTLLARESVVVDRRDLEGGKTELFFRKDATLCDRDKALISMVQSGLMDKNIGLEAFDKGDLTASREEKRIKLVRAQQGELARLIRKIKPIEEATVSLSIPEPSIFKDNQQPMSASVQVTLPNATRLSQNQVRAIINLVVGSIQGLDSKHISVSDTNGTTYNSVLGPDDELGSKLEDQDQYMKQKVASQLDKLVGPGHYVVTVSTLLREATRETMTQQYDPNASVVASKQQFSEKMNANDEAAGAGGLASTYIPNEMKATVTQLGSGGGNRGYRRVGEEVTYSNTRTQTLETTLPGMVEDVSIAVTLDESHYPKTTNANGQTTEMDEQALKSLIAHSASPKVMMDNVSLARVNFSGSMAGSPLEGRSLSAGLTTGNSEGGSSGGPIPSWLVWLGGGIAAFVLLLIVANAANGSRNANGATQFELDRLREMSMQQQDELRRTQQQTQQLMEQQQQAIASNANNPALTGAGGYPQGALPTMTPMQPSNQPLGMTTPMSNVTNVNVGLPASPPSPGGLSMTELQATLDDLRQGTEGMDDAAMGDTLQRFVGSDAT
ncbi:MAG: flagellar M-ring protein FliF C-terminal domain-containing protein [Vampirovibrionales bacterium]|nr:flagellar M-ring protein FliF C-terminal domain-containing protein [Vampirovibrionales bacterium]